MLPSRVSHLVLELAISPTQVSERLAASMDHVRSLLFTVTWGLRGQFVGNVTGDRIAMRVRHGYSNGYTRLLFGRIDATGAGSRLSLEFRDVRFVVVLMNVVGYGILVTSLAYLASVARYAYRGGNVDWNLVAVALSGPFLTLSMFAVVEIIGRRLGRRDEERMRLHLAALFQDVRRA